MSEASNNDLLVKQIKAVEQKINALEKGHESEAEFINSANIMFDNNIKAFKYYISSFLCGIIYQTTFFI